MSRTAPGALWAVFIVGFGLTIASAWTVYREFLPLLQSGTTAASKTSALVARAIVPGPSYRSKLLVLNSCNDALNSVEGAVLPLDERRALLSHCSEIAHAVVATTPTYSLAWYVGALAAEGMGELGKMEAGLVQSQLTAPSQGWLALSRAIVATRHVSELSAEANASLDQDLAVLARSQRGVVWLAGQYLGSSQLAERIASVVETLPDEQQRQFLGSVRRQSQR